MREPAGRDGHQALGDELLQHLERGAGHRLGGVELAAAGERAQRGERVLLVAVEQVEAPVERRAQRLLALGRVARAAVEDRERIAQARRQRRRRQHAEPGRRELDRQRQVADQLADGRHRRQVGRERRVVRSGAIGEQGDALVAGQRGDRVAPLGADAERLAAGREHRQAGMAFEQAGQQRRRPGEVLEVVGDEQQRPGADDAVERVRVGLAGDPRGPQRVAQHGRDPLGVGGGGERGEAAAGGAGDLDRQPRLADAAGPGERHEARVLEQREHGAHVVVAAERRRRRRGRDVLARGRGERRVVGEDRLLEVAQLGPGLEPQLVQRRPGVLEGGERVGVPAGAVEREHLLAAQALAQGMLGDERLELADEAGVLAVVERRPGRGPRSRSPAAPRAGGSRAAAPARSAGRPARARARATGRAGPRARRAPRAAGSRRPPSPGDRRPGRARGAAARRRPAAPWRRSAAPPRPRAPGSARRRPRARSGAPAGRPAARAAVARRGRRGRRRCGPPAVPGCRTRARPGEPTGGPSGAHERDGPQDRTGRRARRTRLCQAGLRRVLRRVRANAKPVAPRAIRTIAGMM